MQKIKCLVFFKSARRICLNFNSIKTQSKTHKLIFAFLNPIIVKGEKTILKTRLTLVR